MERYYYPKRPRPKRKKRPVCCAETPCDDPHSGIWIHPESVPISEFQWSACTNVRNKTRLLKCPVCKHVSTQEEKDSNGH